MRFTLPLFFTAFALPLHAAPTQDWSAAIARDGLTPTEAVIAALPSPSPDDLFALGGVRFLIGIEQALHLRWQVGATAEMAPVPVLRLALPDNPMPEPMRDTLVAEVFQTITKQMAAADQALARVPDGADLGVVINLDDLWLDIDGNGDRTPEEGLTALALGAILNPWEDPSVPAAPTIRFDTADVAWLRAYTHLLSGFSSFVLAFDPTDAITKIRSGNDDKLARLASPNPSTIDQYDDQHWLDRAAIAILALRQQPDPALTRATAAHLKEMVALNRSFWQQVDAETDNVQEWIPNARQQAALGFTLPPDTDVVWLGILAQLEQMLEGKLLVPHIALPPEAGVNIAKYLETPNPLDLIGWIQGADVMPYAERGPVIDGQTWSAFEALVEGRGILFAVLLN